VTRKQKLPGGPGNEEVGYGKPPKSGQFKKGGIGNPWGRAGRPKHDEQALLGVAPGDWFQQERMRTVTYGEGGKSKQAPVARLSIRQLFKKAAEGDMAAIKEVIKYEREESQRAAEEARLDREEAAAYKAKWEPVFQDHLRRGLPPPRFDVGGVHPDDLIIDKFGEVWIILPEVERVAIDTELRARTVRLQNDIAEAKMVLQHYLDKGKHGLAEDVRQELAEMKSHLRMFREHLARPKLDPSLLEQARLVHARPGRRIFRTVEDFFDSLDPDRLSR
jgi:hypothetical protein